MDTDREGTRTGPSPLLRPCSAVLVCGCCVLLCVSPARAWVQATTEEAPHRPLHVADSNCLQYVVAAGCSADVPSDDCLVAVTLGMRAWDLRGSHFRFRPTPEVTCCGAGYERDWTNTNCVEWREDRWPGEYGASTIALTTLTYDPANGAILDADVELNGVGYRFGTDCSADVMDIQNTIAHEAGHMLGLDHTDVFGATMRVYSGPGDCSLRDLAPDDVEGATTLYPYAADPGVCQPPHGGLNADCSDPPPDPGSCGCRAPGSQPGPAASLVALAFVVVAFRIRRRRSRPVR
ncbi:MAG: matrixin family metalloprotease [Deltaproteobacteria bacterium]|nr:matrixin family metalloprotease [Deltaproteobacteria bacterium]